MYPFKNLSFVYLLLQKSGSLIKQNFMLPGQLSLNCVNHITNFKNGITLLRRSITNFAIVNFESLVNKVVLIATGRPDCS
jgi:hypothetical protein